MSCHFAPGHLGRVYKEKKSDIKHVIQRCDPTDADLGRDHFHQFVLWCGVLCCGVLCCAVLCCAVVCYVVVWCAMVCYVVVYCGVVCYVVVWFDVLCYGVMWCCVVCYGVLCQSQCRLVYRVGKGTRAFVLC